MLFRLFVPGALSLEVDLSWWNWLWLAVKCGTVIYSMECCSNQDQQHTDEVNLFIVHYRVSIVTCAAFGVACFRIHLQSKYAQVKSQLRCLKNPLLHWEFRNKSQRQRLRLSLKEGETCSRLQILSKVDCVSFCYWSITDCEAQEHYLARLVRSSLQLTPEGEFSNASSLSEQTRK